MIADKHLYEFYFRHIALYLGFAQEQPLENCDITSQQAHLLRCICYGLEENDSVTRKDLQKYMGGLSGPSVTSLLNALSKKGYIVRHPNDNDGRYMKLALTERGQKIINQMDAAIQTFENQVTEGLQKEQQQELLLLLAKVYDNVSKNSPNR